MLCDDISSQSYLLGLQTTLLYLQTNGTVQATSGSLNRVQQTEELGVTLICFAHFSACCNVIVGQHLC
jgi:hypothetical protein